MNINHDLYSQLFDLIRTKNLGFQVRWMPSHLDDPETKKDKPYWVTENEIRGDAHADRLADTAAQSYAVEANTAKKVIMYTHLVKTIQKIIATIMTDPPKKKIGSRSPAVPKPKPKSLGLLRDESEHNIVVSGYLELYGLSGQIFLQ